MSKKILFIGGTRLLGKNIVEKFIASGKFEISVLSRKANIYLHDNCHIISAERSVGITELAGKEFDIIFDFIAYDENSVKEVTGKLRFGKYIFISTCWMTKLNQSCKADDFIEHVDPEAFKRLPSITQNYLVNKQAAENYLKRNLSPGNFHILRLPIFLGEKDHTKRLEFYVSRFLDNQPVIIVNGGSNICQIANVDDLSKNILDLFRNNILTDQLMLEALPCEAKNVAEVLHTIGSSIGPGSALIDISENILLKELPEYLDVEPLWRECRVEVSKNNIYTLLNSASDPIEVWLKNLAVKEADNKPDSDELRPRELQLINSIFVK